MACLAGVGFGMIFEEDTGGTPALLEGTMLGCIRCMRFISLLLSLEVRFEEVD
jgi:hypothetical protein